MAVNTAWSVAVAASLLFIACIAEPVRTRLSDTSRKWWETAVVYQIYPRSFKDSNGDGVGDLKGIASKLPYLKDLGIAAVWLSPIYPSPQADFGYDISDFTGIDPLYGSMDDFDQLLQSAHNLGLKLILDFVPNHSSDEHEWFKKSVNREEPYTDYYVWADGTTTTLDNGTAVHVPPNNWVQAFRGSAWEWNEVRQQFYLHQYAVKQPDLNYRNDAVVNAMKDAIKFWLKKGVDGIRIDSLHTLFEDEKLRDEPHTNDETDPEESGYLDHIYTQNQPENYKMVQEWRKVLEEFDDQRVMMTETYGTMDQVIDYYGTPENPGASFSFNFNLIISLGASSKASDFKRVIDDWMSRMNEFRKANWVIGNHDQFRVASFYRYGPELADGINMISLLLPGTAMTYNGEEIGMDNTYITWEQSKDPQAVNEGPKNYLSRSRDLERTPFQWDDTISAGFSSNRSTWMPVNSNYWHLNAKAQAAAAHSHLQIYKALVRARKMPAIQSSNYMAKVVGDNILVINRDLLNEPSFVVVVNFGSEYADIQTRDLGDYTSLHVWTSSVNSEKQPGDSLASSFGMRAKEGLVLTTGAVDAPTTQMPRTTSQGATTPKNNSPVTRPAIFAAIASLLFVIWC